MIPEKTLKAIEYDKIMQAVSEFASLENAKKELLGFYPVSSLKEAEILLEKTAEAYKYLYTFSVPSVYFFDDVTDELSRVDMGGTLTMGEILKVGDALRSARLMRNGILSVNDESLFLIKEIASRLYENKEFEEEISKKIISDEEMSDNASQKLSSIRREIRNLNARIRDKLNSYAHGSLSKYLQNDVVTIRQDRYVIPVKSEYRSFVKGFIHDQSSSGATVFIEPEIVIELNNELKRAMLDEAEEVHRILVNLSERITNFSDAIRYNTENLTEIDSFFARAQYAFKNNCSYPLLNDRGIIDIKAGRHPLIDVKTVVPVNVSLGMDYNFMLVTGPNTGGKTVTLKLVGLLSLMAMSGLFVPCEKGSKISVFNGVYCDIGDEQSIEQSLSTFSSHIKNIISILDNIDEKSLVLLDELGAGTDPEEGSALALAVIETLIEKNCFGIITTHYSKLKQYAGNSDKIENASMEFDSKSLRPLYKLNVGIPGSSNAIDIAKTLGLDGKIIERALINLSDKTLNFENVLKKAEASRRESEKLSEELTKLSAEKEKEISVIKEEKEKIIKEREKIYAEAKRETKRIVSEKLEEAEEIIEELKDILKRANLESKDIIRASELKNRIKNSRYLTVENDTAPIEMKPVNFDELKEGVKVYVKTLGSFAIVKSIRKNKNEVEVLLGDVSVIIKSSDIFNAEKVKEDKKPVKINKSGAFNKNALTELNIIGKTVTEGIAELEIFMDQAVVSGLKEVKIIHGVGEGKLLKAVRDYLKNEDKNVSEFRRGIYGEGENGVTIVKLK